MDIATMNRRNFLRLMGIGGATAGAASLVGCAAPKQKSQDGSAPNGEAAENWRDAPKLVSETDIAETIEIDVIVAGEVDVGQRVIALIEGVVEVELVDAAGRTVVCHGVILP